MMNRVDIIQSASMLVRSAKVPNYTAVGRMAGCHRAAISHIVRGKNAATDKMMLSLGDGLRDLSLRAERLADAIDRLAKAKGAAEVDDIADELRAVQGEMAFDQVQRVDDAITAARKRFGK